MNTNKRSYQFCMIGCGRLGTALSVFLSNQEFVPQAFASQTYSSAQRLQKLVGSGLACNDPVQAARQSDIVFLTTPDSQIEKVCQTIANQGGFNQGEFKKDQIVFHLSGALSSTILSSASFSGAHVGSIHPLQSFAPYKKGDSSQFEGINISLEGDEKAVHVGEKIVQALKANSFNIPTESKTLYHAAAVVASNYLVTLEEFALALLKEANLSEKRGYEILEPLIQGTLQNIKSRGTIEALTGPAARGDTKIIENHLADIDKTLPQYSALYRLLGKHTLDLVKKREGVANEKNLKKLKQLFMSK